SSAFMSAYANGVSPNIALEIGRQRIPPEFEIPREL
ncbi:MAG TPA: biopolymer transporter ExbB, partial [Thiomicrorhabdus sp.]|nr:biopolymer transporter ExbB [Thiomicrorhabdus sp.]